MLTRPGSSRGASMIEVLVAIVIVIIGLLGLAGLQARSGVTEVQFLGDGNEVREKSQVQRGQHGVNGS